MHEITAIIPTYNRGALLRRAIDSVLRQTFVPRQIVVVDDGSDDDTPSICEAYQDVIEYVRQPNAGASAARNTGIACARHPWIAFLDSDDHWTEEHLERIDTAIGSTSGAADLYFSDMEMPDADGGGTLWQQIGFSAESPYEMTNDATAWALLPRQPMMLQASVIRRSALVRLNGLDVQFRLIHDSYLFCQLAIAGIACAVPGIGCIQTADDPTHVRLTTVIPLSSEAKIRENCRMWELLYKHSAVPLEFQGVVRFNYADCRWTIARLDLRARRYAAGFVNAAMATAAEPRLAWWLLTHGSLRGYQVTVRPSAKLGPRSTRSREGNIHLTP
jgi:glycosyltransferase involved in cell wall biosynthesis